MILTLEKAAEALRRGAVVGVPTETFYGLAADAFNPGAVASVHKLKNRPPGQPSPVLIASPQVLDACLTNDPGQIARVLMARFWPGGLTLIFGSANPTLPPGVRAGDTVALRQDGEPQLKALMETSGVVAITGTSANLSGEPPIDEGSVVSQLFKGKEAYAGHVGVLRTRGALPSTIVDVSSPRPKVLRKGIVSISELRDALKDVHIDLDYD